MDEISPQHRPSTLAESAALIEDGAPATSAGRFDRLLDIARLPIELFRFGRELLPFQAEQTSMLPTIQPGDRVLAMPIALWEPERLGRGDLVVFQSWHAGEDAAIKRIVALPGDTFALRAHTLSVNGEPLAEPYAVPPTHGVVAPFVLGPGEFFVMGDNRCQSCDSRVHGPLTADRLIGRLIWRDRPVRRMGFIE